MKKLILALAITSFLSAQAAFVEVKSAQEFKDLIETSRVPVVVQFAAYWCGPCQSLRRTFDSLASSYSDNQVRLVYADAYVIRSLQSYLQGGYPTVRTFSNGTTTSASFVGSQTDSYLRSFIDRVIGGTIDRSPAPVGDYCALDGAVR